MLAGYKHVPRPLETPIVSFARCGRAEHGRTFRVGSEQQQLQRSAGFHSAVCVWFGCVCEAVLGLVGQHETYERDIKTLNTISTLLLYENYIIYISHRQSTRTLMQC
jgi:hypothetical protein